MATTAAAEIPETLSSAETAILMERIVSEFTMEEFKNSNGVGDLDHLHKPIEHLEEPDYNHVEGQREGESFFQSPSLAAEETRSVHENVVEEVKLQKDGQSEVVEKIESETELLKDHNEGVIEEETPMVSQEDSLQPKETEGKSMHAEEGQQNFTVIKDEEQVESRAVEMEAEVASFEPLEQVTEDAETIEEPRTLVNDKTEAIRDIAIAENPTIEEGHRLIEEADEEKETVGVKETRCEDDSEADKSTEVVLEEKVNQTGDGYKEITDSKTEEPNVALDVKVGVNGGELGGALEDKQKEELEEVNDQQGQVEETIHDDQSLLKVIEEQEPLSKETTEREACTLQKSEKEIEVAEDVSIVDVTQEDGVSLTDTKEDLKVAEEEVENPEIVVPEIISSVSMEGEVKLDSEEVKGSALEKATIVNEDAEEQNQVETEDKLDLNAVTEEETAIVSQEDSLQPKETEDKSLDAHAISEDGREEQVSLQTLLWTKLTESGVKGKECLEEASYIQVEVKGNTQAEIEEAKSGTQEKETETTEVVSSETEIPEIHIKSEDAEGKDKIEEPEKQPASIGSVEGSICDDISNEMVNDEQGNAETCGEVKGQATEEVGHVQEIHEESASIQSVETESLELSSAAGIKDVCLESQKPIDSQVEEKKPEDEVEALQSPVQECNTYENEPIPNEITPQEGQSSSEPNELIQDGNSTEQNVDEYEKVGESQVEGGDAKDIHETLAQHEGRDCCIVSREDNEAAVSGTVEIEETITVQEKEAFVEVNGKIHTQEKESEIIEAVPTEIEVNIKSEEAEEDVDKIKEPVKQSESTDAENRSICDIISNEGVKGEEGNAETLIEERDAELPLVDSTEANDAEEETEADNLESKETPQLGGVEFNTMEIERSKMQMQDTSSNAQIDDASETTKEVIMEEDASYDKIGSEDTEVENLGAEGENLGEEPATEETALSESTQGIKAVSEKTTSASNLPSVELGDQTDIVEPTLATEQINDSATIVENVTEEAVTVESEEAKKQELSSAEVKEEVVCSEKEEPRQLEANEGAQDIQCEVGELKDSRDEEIDLIQNVITTEEGQQKDASVLFKEDVREETSIAIQEIVEESENECLVEPPEVNGHIETGNEAVASGTRGKESEITEDLSSEDVDDEHKIEEPEKQPKSTDDDSICDHVSDELGVNDEQASVDHQTSEEVEEQVVEKQSISKEIELGDTEEIHQTSNEHVTERSCEIEVQVIKEEITTEEEISVADVKEETPIEEVHTVEGEVDESENLKPEREENEITKAEEEPEEHVSSGDKTSGSDFSSVELGDQIHRMEPMLEAETVETEETEKHELSSAADTEEVRLEKEKPQQFEANEGILDVQCEVGELKTSENEEIELIQNVITTQEVNDEQASAETSEEVEEQVVEHVTERSCEIEKNGERDIDEGDTKLEDGEEKPVYEATKGSDSEAKSGQFAEAVDSNEQEATSESESSSVKLHETVEKAEMSNELVKHLEIENSNIEAIFVADVKEEIPIEEVHIVQREVEETEKHELSSAAGTGEVCLEKEEPQQFELNEGTEDIQCEVRELNKSKDGENELIQKVITSTKGQDGSEQVSDVEKQSITEITEVVQDRIPAEQMVDDEAAKDNEDTKRNVEGDEAIIVQENDATVLVKEDVEEETSTTIQETVEESEKECLVEPSEVNGYTETEAVATGTQEKDLSSEIKVPEIHIKSEDVDDENKIEEPEKQNTDDSICDHISNEGVNDEQASAETTEAVEEQVFEEVVVKENISEENEINQKLDGIEKVDERESLKLEDGSVTEEIDHSSAEHVTERTCEIEKKVIKEEISTEDVNEETPIEEGRIVQEVDESGNVKVERDEEAEKDEITKGDAETEETTILQEKDATEHDTVEEEIAESEGCAIKNLNTESAEEQQEIVAETDKSVIPSEEVQDEHIKSDKTLEGADSKPIYETSVQQLTSDKEADFEEQGERDSGSQEATNETESSITKSEETVVTEDEEISCSVEVADEAVKEMTSEIPSSAAQPENESKETEVPSHLTFETNKEEIQETETKESISEAEDFENWNLNIREDVIDEAEKQHEIVNEKIEPFEDVISHAEVDNGHEVVESEGIRLESDRADEANEEKGGINEAEEIVEEEEHIISSQREMKSEVMAEIEPKETNLGSEDSEIKNSNFEEISAADVSKSENVAVVKEEETPIEEEIRSLSVEGNDENKEAATTSESSAVDSQIVKEAGDQSSAEMVNSIEREIESPEAHIDDSTETGIVSSVTFETREIIREGDDETEEAATKSESSTSELHKQEDTSSILQDKGAEEHVKEETAEEAHTDKSVTPLEEETESPGIVSSDTLETRELTSELNHESVDSETKNLNPKEATILDVTEADEKKNTFEEEKGTVSDVCKEAEDKSVCITEEGDEYETKEAEISSTIPIESREITSEAKPEAEKEEPDSDPEKSGVKKLNLEEVTVVDDVKLSSVEAEGPVSGEYKEAEEDSSECIREGNDEIKETASVTLEAREIISEAELEAENKPSSESANSEINSSLNLEEVTTKDAKQSEDVIDANEEKVHEPADMIKEEMQETGIASGVTFETRELISEVKPEDGKEPSSDSDVKNSILEEVTTVDVRQSENAIEGSEQEISFVEEKGTVSGENVEKEDTSECIREGDDETEEAATTSESSTAELHKEEDISSILQDKDAEEHVKEETAEETHTDKSVTPLEEETKSPGIASGVTLETRTLTSEANHEFVDSEAKILNPEEATILDVTEADEKEITFEEEKGTVSDVCKEEEDKSVCRTEGGDEYEAKQSKDVIDANEEEVHEPADMIKEAIQETEVEGEKLCEKITEAREATEGVRFTEDEEKYENEATEQFTEEDVYAAKENYETITEERESSTAFTSTVQSEDIESSKEVAEEADASYDKSVGFEVVDEVEPKLSTENGSELTESTSKQDGLQDCASEDVLNEAEKIVEEEEQIIFSPREMKSEAMTEIEAKETILGSEDSEIKNSNFEEISAADVQKSENVAVVKEEETPIEEVRTVDDEANLICETSSQHLAVTEEIRSVSVEGNDETKEAATTSESSASQTAKEASDQSSAEMVISIERETESSDKSTETGIASGVTFETWELISEVKPEDGKEEPSSDSDIKSSSLEDVTTVDVKQSENVIEGSEQEIFSVEEKGTVSSENTEKEDTSECIRDGDDEIYEAATKIESSTAELHKEEDMSSNLQDKDVGKHVKEETAEEMYTDKSVTPLEEETESPGIASSATLETVALTSVVSHESVDSETKNLNPEEATILDVTEADEKEITFEKEKGTVSDVCKEVEDKSVCITEEVDEYETKEAEISSTIPIESTEITSETKPEAEKEEPDSDPENSELKKLNLEEVTAVDDVKLSSMEAEGPVSGEYKKVEEDKNECIREGDDEIKETACVTLEAREIISEAEPKAENKPSSESTDSEINSSLNLEDNYEIITEERESSTAFTPAMPSEDTESAKEVAEEVNSSFKKSLVGVEVVDEAEAKLSTENGSELTESTSKEDGLQDCASKDAVISDGGPQIVFEDRKITPEVKSEVQSREIFKGSEYVEVESKPAPENIDVHPKKVEDNHETTDEAETLTTGFVAVERNIDTSYGMIGAEEKENKSPAIDLSLSDLLHKARDQNPKVATPLTEERDMAVSTLELHNEETDVHEAKTDEEADEAEVMVESSKDIDLKTPKKHSNILSGVSSKVKHSISKVKKAITGKSSSSKTKVSKTNDALPAS